MQDVADSGARAWLRRIPFLRRFIWLNVYAEERPDPEHFYTCPCCGHATLTTRGRFEICDVCNWEDDGQDDHDSWVVRGGPNGSMSLDDARSRFIASGGVLGLHVPPTEPR